MPPDDRAIAGAPAAADPSAAANIPAAVVDPEPLLPPRPDIPPESAPYMDPDLKTFEHYPLAWWRQLWLTLLSKAHLPAVLAVIFGAVAGATYGLFSNDEPITPRQPGAALVPKPLRDWSQASPVTLGPAVAALLALLIALFPLAERAHKALDREGDVLGLREKPAEWQRQKTFGKGT
jgi:hypothetical protein